MGDVVKAEVTWVSPAEYVKLREELAAARAELDAVWKATGVAGSVRGMVSLEDVVATHRAELVELREQVEAIKATWNDENMGRAHWTKRMEEIVNADPEDSPLEKKPR